MGFAVLGPSHEAATSPQGGQSASDALKNTERRGNELLRAFERTAR